MSTPKAQWPDLIQFTLPLGLAALLLLAAAPGSQAENTNILTASDGFGSTSWNAAGNWLYPAPPGPGTNYYTGAYTLRTPPGAGNYTFAGDSLTLSSGGQLNIKGGSGNIITINILTNAGAINDAINPNAIAVIAGNMKVVGAAALNTSSGSGDVRTITNATTMSGSGTLTNTCSNGAYPGTVVFTGNNAGFTGPLIVNDDTTLQAGSQASLGGNPAGFNAAQLVLDDGIFMPTASMSLNNANSGVTLGPGGGTFNVGAGLTLTIASPVAGPGNLTNGGAGNLVLSGTNTYTGSTLVNAGALSLTSSSGTASVIPNTPLIAVAPAAVLNVTGLTGGFTLGAAQNLVAGSSGAAATNINGNITISGTNNVAGAGTVGTEIINGNLTLAGGTLLVDFTNSGVSDLILLSGGSPSLTQSGTTTILPMGGSLPDGTYVLITNLASSSVAGTFAVPALARGITAVFSTAAPKVSLTVSGSASGPAALVWRGMNGANWDATTINWTNAAAGDFDHFYNGDNVTFDDSGYVNNVVLVGVLAPGSVVVSSVNTNYYFGGSGSITGSAALTKSGAATLTIANTNTYIGNTTISAGTLALTGGGALASPAIVIGGGATFDVSGLASAFTLGLGQTLSNSASTAVLKGNVGTGSGTVWLTYANGLPALAVTNGALTLSAATTFNVTLTGSALTAGSYKLISTNGGTGAVAGSLPAVTLAGNFPPSLGGSLSLSNSQLYLLLTTNQSGFVVNGSLPPQTGSVMGQNNCCSGDVVTAVGSFAAAFAKNSLNIYYPDFVYLNSNEDITSPGTQPLQLQTGTFIGSDSNAYTNFTYYQSLIYFSAGGLTNNGWLNYSNVNDSLGNSTYLTAFDGQIGTAPGVTGNFNRNYYWGSAVYIDDGNVNYWGGPVYVMNGAVNNTNATMSAVVGGSYQDFVAGLDVFAWYGTSTNPGITEVNYGTIAGSYTGTYNGAAAGIYNFTDYGGQNITNFASGTITANAPYYADAIYAWCQYGNLNLVQNGIVTGTATGGQQGNTTGIGDAVGMDLFTYSPTNTASINLLTTGTTTATANASTNVFAVAVFCWAEGGSFTFTNTGTLTATGHCSSPSASCNVNTFYGGSDKGPVTLCNSGTVIGTADPDGGGWAYGTENDSGNSISIANSGTISHNTGLGLFIFGSGGGTATVTNSGSIYGGNEGIAAEHYTGELTIYDTGPVRGGSSNNNAMDLGSGNDTVHLYGLPNIVGWMNGQGGSNLLDFELTGTLQQVNGAAPTLGNNLAAYNFNPATGNSIVVSGQTYQWVNFYVTGSVTAPDTNAYLTGLVLTPAGALSPAFMTNGFTYWATNAYGASPTVSVTNADPTATDMVSFNGGAYAVLTNGMPSSPLALSLGVTNQLKVLVTAQNGVTTNLYTVNIIEQPSRTKPVLTNRVSGSALTLTWPADHLGWTLQTNSVGLAATNQWFAYPGSASLTSVTINMIPANAGVFFRLVYP
jgi:autotransporter-associated beta strand protein